MTGMPTLAGLAVAETRKLFLRMSVRATLGALVLLALGVPAIVLLLSTVVQVSAEAQAAGVEPPTFLVSNAVGGVLQLRNFLLFRILLITVIAVSVAGEFVGRTLREDLVRPVGRAAVLGAKWCALQVFVVAGTLVPLIVSLLPSVLLFELDADLSDTLIRFGLTWLGDVAFSTFVMAIAVVVRSVPGTLGGVVVFYVAESAVGWVLWGVDLFQESLRAVFAGRGLTGMDTALDIALAVRPWMPSAAFDLYRAYDASVALPWQSLVALVGYTLGSWALAVGVFQRMDVD